MMAEKYRVMFVGPLLAAKHFFPKLERASDGKIVALSPAVSRQLTLPPPLLIRH